MQALIKGEPNNKFKLIFHVQQTYNWLHIYYNFFINVFAHYISGYLKCIRKRRKIKHFCGVWFSIIYLHFLYLGNSGICILPSGHSVNASINSLFTQILDSISFFFFRLRQNKNTKIRVKVNNTIYL